MRRLAHSSLWQCYVTAWRRALDGRSRNLPASTTWWTRSSLMVWQLEGAEKKASNKCLCIYQWKEACRFVPCQPKQVEHGFPSSLEYKTCAWNAFRWFPFVWISPHIVTWLRTEGPTMRWFQHASANLFSAPELRSFSFLSCEVPCHHVQCQCSATPSTCLYRCICDGSFSLHYLQQFDNCICRTLAHDNSQFQCSTTMCLLCLYLFLLRYFCRDLMEISNRKDKYDWW